MAATIKWTDGSTESQGDGCCELRLKLKLDHNKMEEGAVMVLKHVRPQWSADRVGFRVSLQMADSYWSLMGRGRGNQRFPPRPQPAHLDPYFFKQSNSEHQLPA